MAFETIKNGCRLPQVTSQFPGTSFKFSEPSTYFGLFDPVLTFEVNLKRRGEARRNPDNRMHGAIFGPIVKLCGQCALKSGGQCDGITNYTNNSDLTIFSGGIKANLTD